MSSAGHIMDMINRMKQNRSHQASKKSKYRDRRDHILEDKTFIICLIHQEKGSKNLCS